jgi:hypothetical protein
MAASVQHELTRMRMILQELEERLDAGEVPPDGLPEFKSTVDEIRLRVWALLTAAGAEFCRTLTQELSTGQVSAGHPEWPEVQQVATQLSAAITLHTGAAA